MVFNAKGELLLIRNSYGRRHLFVLPGGGIKRGESPEAAARREVKEEVGLDVPALALRSVHQSTEEGWGDTIHLFTGTADGTPKADEVEVEEAGFYPLDSLPQGVSNATLRRIAEHRGEREPDGRW